mmetsp:Transcript_72494/g.115019  ORF Transcript_72494/g.115019 Transcript_72494/m.115019 type:complete len:228 (-) Transcript_72494:296-979(-)
MELQPPRILTPLHMDVHKQRRCWMLGRNWMQTRTFFGVAARGLQLLSTRRSRVNLTIWPPFSRWLWLTKRRSDSRHNLPSNPKLVSQLRINTTTMPKRSLVSCISMALKTSSKSTSSQTTLLWQAMFMSMICEWRLLWECWDPSIAMLDSPTWDGTLTSSLQIPGSAYSRCSSWWNRAASHLGETTSIASSEERALTSRTCSSLTLAVWTAWPGALLVLANWSRKAL